MQWHNICIYLWFLPVNQKLYWVSSFDRLMEFFFRDLYVLMWKPYMYLIKSYHLSIMPMWFYVRYSVNSIGRFTGFWVFCINILFVTSTSLYTVLLREESPPPSTTQYPPRLYGTSDPVYHMVVEYGSHGVPYYDLYCLTTLVPSGANGVAP